MPFYSRSTTCGENADAISRVAWFCKAVVTAPNCITGRGYLPGVLRRSACWSGSQIDAAEVALPKVRNGADIDGFYKAKLRTARFFMERLLPQSGALFTVIMVGGRSIMEFDDAAL